MKQAFTLAEVLITLAIIGIIAAITIPSLIESHEKKELEVRFAKVYRTLLQAVNLSKAENGSIDLWTWKDNMSAQEQNEFAKKYFLPYLNVVKFCPAPNPQGCFAKDGQSINGGKFSLESWITPQVVLADGTSIDIRFHSSSTDNYYQNIRTLTFQVDINGFKGPNTIGRDIFAFIFYRQTGEFLPFGVYLDNSYNAANNTFARYTDEQVDEQCFTGGWSCTAKLIQNGFKMNY